MAAGSHGNVRDNAFAKGLFSRTALLDEQCCMYMPSVTRTVHSFMSPLVVYAVTMATSPQLTPAKWSQTQRVKTLQWDMNVDTSVHSLN